MNSNKRALCGAIGGAPALRQVPPFSTQGPAACAQELVGQEHSTRIPTKGQPVIHGTCFASSSSRKRCIGKGRSVLSAILSYQKHPSQRTGVFRAGARLKLFRSTSCKQGTVPFWPPSQTPPKHAISIDHLDRIEAQPIPETSVNVPTEAAHRIAQTRTNTGRANESQVG